MAELEMKKREISFLSHLLYSLFFTVLLVFCAMLQCSEISFFGVIPDITFALACAIGFVAGEKYGAVFGLIGGLLIMYLGSGDISLSPVMLTLCGYICGALPNVILRRNLLSYIVYIPMMGVIHVLFTLIYYIMLSESYDIWSVFVKQIIPELILCFICMIAAYGAVKLIYLSFKGKKESKQKKQ